MIYYANDWNLDVRAQSEDRAHRIGQTVNVTYIDLVTPNSLDAAIVSALKRKKDLAELVLSDGLRGIL
jgi:SNF2 family DNA or RNA helicase